MSESSTIENLVASLRAELERRPPGDRLPATRELVRRHRVSPVSVSRALGVLTAEGLITTRPGAGTFVATPTAAVAPRGRDVSWQTVALGDRAIDARGIQVYLEPVAPGVISLAGGYLHPSLVPTRALTAALSRAGRRPDAWERPPLAGIGSLRSWFAACVESGTTAEDVVITSGGQAALSVALRAIVPAGEPLLVESPTYPGALAAARAAGIRPGPVPVDDQGIRPDLLADAFAITGARCLYLQPLFHNPTGTVLAAERRGEVLAAAAAAGAFVVEDDYARALVHETPPPPPLIADDSDGRVIHIASLTKPAAPSLRVGALIARGPVAQRLGALRVVDDLFVARVVQEAALELVTAPGWKRHLTALGAELRRRRDALLSALATELPDFQAHPAPRGGMHVWVRLPDGVEERALAAACLQAGVLISVGRPYFASEPPSQHARLSFTGTARLDDIGEAVCRLAVAAGRRSG